MRKLTNVDKIQEFRRKLYEKAKANLKYRFYGLYDKTYRKNILEEASRRAKTNGGTSGVDGEAFVDIEKHGRTEYLWQYSDERAE